MCCKAFHTSIYVPGNHEYFQSQTKPNTNPDATDRWFRRLPILYNIYNFIFLNEGDTYTMNENTVFVGATMWSPIKEHEWTLTQLNVSNHHRINYKKNWKWTPEVQTAVFEDHYYSMEYNLRQLTNVKVVAISHYVPHLLLISEKFKGNPLNSSFFFPGEKLLEFADVWIYGHTHSVDNNKKFVNKCLCVSNPIGYPDEHSGLPTPWKTSIEI